VLTLNVQWRESVVITLPDGRTMKVHLIQPGLTRSKLGFEAPRDIKIMRQTLLDKIAKEAPDDSQPAQADPRGA
jgi:sRNA-binding carbon storage regulator CsrA